MKAEALHHAARPRSAAAHMAGTLALVAEDAAIYDLKPDQAHDLRFAIEGGTVPDALSRLGLDLAPALPSARAEPIRALALTVAQTCNLACTYCYAAGGSFGGPDTRMKPDVAFAAVDRLIATTPPGGQIRIAFMGGEPMVARDLIRATVAHANHHAAARAIGVGYSITTNATLVRPDDAAFFAQHRFAVTVSLDGARGANDGLRPMKGGGGSFDRVARALAPLLVERDRLSLSARVTVTPRNLNLKETMQALGALGFSSVGVSPMLTSPTGQDALTRADLVTLLDQMVACGDDWLAATLAGNPHPFANLETVLRELHRGAPRSLGCGAARDYLAVDADGSYAACHRFVGDPLGQMGDLGSGVDETARAAFVAARSVERQSPCQECWARRLCGGGCHHEVLKVGRPACDHIRGWLHYGLTAYARMIAERPDWFDARA